MSNIPQTDQLVNIGDSEYRLLTDSQDVVSVLDSVIGMPATYKANITAAYVKVGDGCYLDIWLSESARPFQKSSTYHNLAYYGAWM